MSVSSGYLISSLQNARVEGDHPKGQGSWIYVVWVLLDSVDPAFDVLVIS